MTNLDIVLKSRNITLPTKVRLVKAMVFPTVRYGCELLLLLLSCFSSVRLCVTPQTAAHQAPRPWDSPGKNTGVGCHFLLQCMKVKSEREVTQSYPTLRDPMDRSQAPLSMGFSRQEYWSGVPSASPPLRTRDTEMLHT